MRTLYFGVSLLMLGAVPAAEADVSISNKPTQNVSCDAGVCTATASKAVLNVNDLQTMLASSDVAVKTGTVTKDIDIDQPLSWNSSSRLTLDAQQSVIIKKQVTIAGIGALTITTNGGGTGGDLSFENKGNATFSDVNSSLVINGQSFVLVQDIATLATDIAANPSGAYALANSYDAKQDVFDTVPIPTTFAGIFEGLGQTISHLRIWHHLKSQEGFFAYINVTGAVRDLYLKNADVRSSSAKTSTGALAGTNAGVITNVSVDGTVQGAANSMGGIAGTNSGTMVHASAMVNVTGTEGAGGLVGDSRYGTITNSHASVNVSGNVAGGLVGNGANITLSSATGSVTGGDGARVGGLAGVGENIDQSFATGTVTGGNNDACIGGLVGVGSFITNSYSFGSVFGGSGKVGAGGFGGCVSTVSTSYSIGPISAGEHSEMGGFLGKGYKKKSLQGYWDTETSGTSQACGNNKCPNVTGLTTEQLQSGLPAGFDPNIWGRSPSINGGYPYLLANPPQ